ncbi:hypothetical protein MUP01_14465 [Candidatus Bathyarchaeota archaeon]|nr:hypothetical protein [Candidatus Bathyarchaeota archaeon]
MTGLVYLESSQDHEVGKLECQWIPCPEHRLLINAYDAIDKCFNMLLHGLHDFEESEINHSTFNG